MCSLVFKIAPNRCQLDDFFGSPDAVSQLPDTVSELGLSISSAEESRVVSALKTWKGLRSLGEWREKRICWAKGFECNSEKKILFFYYLSANICKSV